MVTDFWQNNRAGKKHELSYPITIAGSNLAKCVGNALDYSTPMTSFSPFYSDVGLGFEHNGGIKCLYLHYNRKTTRCFDPFMSIPSSLKGQECSVTSVAQLLEDGTMRVAFCDHNTWIVECNGVRRLDFGVSHDSSFEEMRCSAHADRYARRMVDTFMDRETGLFWDRRVTDGAPVRIKTPACFLRMLAGVLIADAEMRAAIRNELLNPASFFGSMPFPSVAYDQACYQPGKCWRGPTWLPVAYLMLLLLDKAVYDVEAMNARRILYRAIIQDGNIREHFNPQTGEGLGAYAQGWTAAICLKLHLEISAQTGKIDRQGGGHVNGWS